MAARELTLDKSAYALWAGYLCKSETQTDIHVEAPRRRLEDFRDEYLLLTGEQLPQSGYPVCIVSDSAKYGVQCRFYFNYNPEHTELKDILRDQVKIRKSQSENPLRLRKRINSGFFVRKLFKLGFHIGRYQFNKDYERIRSEILPENADDFIKGYKL